MPCSYCPGWPTLKGTEFWKKLIYLESSLQNWSQLRLTTDYVQQLASSQNIVAPGGMLEGADGRVFVKPQGDMSKLFEDINQIAVGTVNG